MTLRPRFTAPGRRREFCSLGRSANQLIIYRLAVGIAHKTLLARQPLAIFVLRTTSAPAMVFARDQTKFATTTLNVSEAIDCD